MVCGLLWLGEGLLGSIGLAFNDALGRALAQRGMATVQLHTPQRHLARTRLMELALTAALPLCLLPGLRALLLATDLAMLATSKKDLYLLMILLLPGLLDVLAAALAVPARPRSFGPESTKNVGKAMENLENSRRLDAFGPCRACFFVARCCSWARWAGSSAWRTWPRASSWYRCCTAPSVWASIG